MWLNEDRKSGDALLASDITGLSYAYQNMAMNTNVFDSPGKNYTPPVHELEIKNTTTTRIPPYCIAEPVETNDPSGVFYVRPYTGGNINYLIIVDGNGLDGDSTGWGSLAIDPVFMRHSMRFDSEPDDQGYLIIQYNMGNTFQKFFGPKPNDASCIGYPNLPPFVTMGVGVKSTTGNLILVRQRFNVEYADTAFLKYTVPANTMRKGANVPATATYIFNIAVSNYVPDQVAENTVPDKISMKVYKVSGGTEIDLEIDGETDWMRYQLPKGFYLFPPSGSPPIAPLLTIQSGFSRSGLARLKKGETIGYRLQGPQSATGSVNSFINIRRVAPYFDGTL